MMAFKYFKREEFACKHCGKNLIKDAFISKCDELRERCGFSLSVSSGYRCPAHNDKVSSTGRTGPHTTGEAADFTVSRHRAYDILRHALAIGFTGIGVQQKGGSRFIHLDTLAEPAASPRPTVWSY